MKTWGQDSARCLPVKDVEVCCAAPQILTSPNRAASPLLCDSARSFTWGVTQTEDLRRGAAASTCGEGTEHPSSWGHPLESPAAQPE